MAGVVTIIEQGAEPRTQPFDGTEITIGRAPENSVVLQGGAVGERHCRVVASDRRLVIFDLKTAAGTFVNGRRLNGPQPVGPRDKVVVGPFTLQFALGVDGSASVAPGLQEAAGEVEEFSEDEVTPTSSPVGPHLSVWQGATCLMRVALVGTHVIGRAATCSIPIDNRALSRQPRSRSRGDRSL